ncbi:hypothetical protein LTR78_001063 [Recurvomyces mirabilis]|uniref:Uncharacterized protein n=1 Tax=Recurvomyces mirabilis TaxID=574656 RepID=A0AAE0WWB3_9PEZI|nr:hypothetical protein LTR78_001063 [Recurvomyces mirabilis]KAK5159035.1 hypothetical protein LTS14_003143 [Recurvomyces mirabilis]
MNDPHKDYLKYDRHEFDKADNRGEQASCDRYQPTSEARETAVLAEGQYAGPSGENAACPVNEHATTGERLAAELLQYWLGGLHGEAFETRSRKHKRKQREQFPVMFGLLDVLTKYNTALHRSEHDVLAEHNGTIEDRLSLDQGRQLSDYFVAETERLEDLNRELKARLDEATARLTSLEEEQNANEEHNMLKRILTLEKSIKAEKEARNQSGARIAELNDKLAGFKAKCKTRLKSLEGDRDASNEQAIEFKEQIKSLSSQCALICTSVRSTCFALWKRSSSRAERYLDEAEDDIRLAEGHEPRYSRKK